MKKAVSAPDKSHLVKVGFQSPDDPLKYILSTDVVDRMGDIVEQDWQLKDFKKNPISLFMHQHSNPIGVWKNVKVEAGKLVGTLDLAKEGTSAVIDTVRSLVAQRILKAVSVGFSVGGHEARYDENDNFEGYRLKKPNLHEASLVSVPANQECLQVAKSFNLSDSDIKHLYSDIKHLFSEQPVDKTAETGLLQTNRNKLSLLKIRTS